MEDPRLSEFLSLATDEDTIASALLVLADTGESAVEHGTRMAEAGQPYFASDYIALALKRGELDEKRAWGLVDRAFRKLEEFEAGS